MVEVDYPGFAYGAAVALGGIMGYVKKRSVPSLVAGVACGSLALFGAYMVRFMEDPTVYSRVGRTWSKSS